MIYLDNAATTHISPEVVEEMLPFLGERFGNPGAIYKIGREAAQAVDKARERVARLFGAEPEQIIFTSGGSEANNMVFKGIEPHLLKYDKSTVIVSKTEHDSVMKAAEAFSERSLFSHTDFIPVNRFGEVRTDELEEMLDCCGAVGLVSVMYVNNETGAVNDVEAVGRLCRKHKVLFHTDCVQAAGCQPINVGKIDCDFATVSSHKIHGCKGVGALYVRDKSLLSPIIHGGSTQEFGLRGGTENVPGIVGFGKAAVLAYEAQEAALEKVTNLKLRFFKTVSERLIKRGFHDVISVNGKLETPGKTLNLCFKNTDAETLVLMLDAKDVCISAGSACRSHESEPSSTLLAMGLTPDEARDSVRISFSGENTPEETEKAAVILADCIAMMSDMKTLC